MTLIKNIYDYINSVAPFDTQAQWDNSGLLVGDNDTTVTKVLLALDITDSVVKEAQDMGCELIISHHPVIFSPLSHIGSDHIVYKLIKANISAICAHTNLDIAENIGVNECLAKKLSLQNTTLYPEDFLCMGTLDKTMSAKEFAQHVKISLSCDGIRYTNSEDIKTVAVCSGSGSDAIELKEKYNFDAIVTGEIKHHHFLYAQERNFCAIEAGHFNTEDVVISPLKELLCNTFTDVKFFKSQSLYDAVNFI